MLYNYTKTKEVSEFVNTTNNWLSNNFHLLDKQTQTQSKFIFPSLTELSTNNSDSKKSIMQTLSFDKNLINPRFIDVEFIDGYKQIKILNKLTNNTIYIYGCKPNDEIGDFINIQNIFKSNINFNTFIINSSPLYPDMARDFDLKRQREDDTNQYFMELNENKYSDYSFKDSLSMDELRDIADYQILKHEKLKLYDGMFYTYVDNKPYEFDFSSNCLISYFVDNKPKNDSTVYFSDIIEEELMKLWVLNYDLDFTENIWKRFKILQQLNALELLQGGIDDGCYKCTAPLHKDKNYLFDLMYDKKSGLFAYKTDLTLKYILNSLSNKKDQNVFVLMHENLTLDLLKKLLESYKQQRISNSIEYNFMRKRFLNGLVRDNTQANELELINKRKIVECILGFKIIEEDKDVETLGDKLSQGFDQLEKDSKMSANYTTDHKSLIKDNLRENKCGIINMLFENDFPNLKASSSTVDKPSVKNNPLYKNAEYLNDQKLVSSHTQDDNIKKIGKFKKKNKKDEL